MGIRDEYGELSGVPEEAEEGGEERYEDDLDTEFIEERDHYLTLLDAEQDWARRHAGFSSGQIPDGPYERAVEQVQDLEYTEETIERYCREQTWTDERRSRRKGLFLSALINEHDGQEYTLPDLSITTSNGAQDGLEYVGYRNTKDITIRGAAGDHLGMQMKAGTLRVEGVAGGETGQSMTGGTIHVQGDAGGLFFDGVGRDMDGGTLLVDGDACGEVGPGMTDGRIKISGDAHRQVGRWQEGGAILLDGTGIVAPERDGGTIHRDRGNGYEQVAPLPDLDLPDGIQKEVEELVDACRGWRIEDRDSYESALDAADPLDYTPDAVYAFAEHGLEHPYDGHFLTAVMATHDNTTFRLPALPDTDYVRPHAVDTLTVEGDIGDHAGHGMTTGTLTVHGDAGSYTGENMQGGTIEIHGDATGDLGEGMTDGTIRVHGTVHNHAPVTHNGRIQQKQGGDWTDLDTNPRGSVP